MRQQHNMNRYDPALGFTHVTCQTVCLLLQSGPYKNECEVEVVCTFSGLDVLTEAVEVLETQLWESIEESERPKITLCSPEGDTLVIQGTSEGNQWLTDLVVGAWVVSVEDCPVQDIEDLDS